MSRKSINIPNRSQRVVEGLYKDLERRIEASPPGLCPVDMSLAFLELCHSQTCGKCTPCRIGLGQLKLLISDVLEGRADETTLPLMEKNAKSIMQSADCAIGYEAAHMVYKGLIGYREDYEAHIRDGRCACQYKHPVPCVAMCPAGVDVPGYIALAHAGRHADAVRLIRKDNPFPTTCAFICENPCEARCRRNMVDSAINIRGIKRFVADNAGFVPPPSCAPATGKEIAVIGGGPGGLSAAYYLQLMGHQVTIYESLPQLGGMLRYGIPNYRLPKDRLDHDIQAILDTGVKVIHGKYIGKDVTLQQLRDDYDAVLITIGASTYKTLGIENEDAEGIMPAVTMLRDVSKGTEVDLKGHNVVVIGGGNVAMDAVRTAVRLGAKKVSAVYRRRIADMTALPNEIHGAVAESVEIVTLSAPSRIVLDENGAVSGLEILPQMISAIKDGRASVKPSGLPTTIIPCTRIISAIGQNIETAHIVASGVPVERGKIKTASSGGFEGMPDVFAGGDCATGPATVIQAIAAAKVVAANIDEFLGYHHTIDCPVEIPVPRVIVTGPCGRVNAVERDSQERIHDFDGVELCMTPAEGHQESGRCLRCDHFGYGIFKGGRETSW
ncbi:NAD(P)-binding protein [Bengtsoniella intestinalis]|uniref:NAD(P)-binding protein n=1 Tax=Bengtsoniella intestinalis TaxID=3073143 RepID=UPI00391F4100